MICIVMSIRSCDSGKGRLPVITCIKVQGFNRSEIHSICIFWIRTHLPAYPTECPNIARKVEMRGEKDLRCSPSKRILRTCEYQGSRGCTVLEPQRICRGIREGRRVSGLGIAGTFDSCFTNSSRTKVRDEGMMLGVDENVDLFEPCVFVLKRRVRVPRMYSHP